MGRFSFLGLFSLILVLNFNISKLLTPTNGGQLICVDKIVKSLSFSFDSQIADLLWLNFLQEIDAYNEGKIADQYLCLDGSSSWHFHVLDIAIDLDNKFYELMAVGPLVVSITINDSKGATLLFDKAVKNFPNDWRILYQASYQAQFEEGNLKKAADLLYRAALNGAPRWTYSLAGGLYSQVGMKQASESIYFLLKEKFPDDEVTKRLKSKLENKIKNFFEKK